MSERLDRLEQEYHNWVEMHTSIIPSENLIESKLDAIDRWWLLQQAKRAEELEEENRRLKAFYDYFSELYGKGLEVVNWHMNGDLEPFDEFFDCAEQEME